MLNYQHPDAGYDANAFPIGQRIASYVLSIFVVGTVLLQAATTAAAIVT